jgi:hypothetical protein
LRHKIRQRQIAAGLEHPKRFGEKPPALGKMKNALHRQHPIEHAIRQRQRAGITLHEFNLIACSRMHHAPRALQLPLVDVDAGDMNIREIFVETGDGAAEAATHIEHLLAVRHLRGTVNLLAQRFGCLRVIRRRLPGMLRLRPISAGGAAPGAAATHRNKADGLT